jgi:hypothetical protein
MHTHHTTPRISYTHVMETIHTHAHFKHTPHTHHEHPALCRPNCTSCQPQTVDRIVCAAFHVPRLPSPMTVVLLLLPPTAPLVPFVCCFFVCWCVTRSLRSPLLCSDPPHTRGPTPWCLCVQGPLRTARLVKRQDVRVADRGGAAAQAQGDQPLFASGPQLHGHSPPLGPRVLG